MKISSILEKDNIIMNLKSKNKKSVIVEMINYLYKNKKIAETEHPIQAVMEREKIGTTGMGQGVAIPHGRTTAVNDLVASFGISREGIDFEALDGEKVHLVFLLLSPLKSTGKHLKALATISRIFSDKFVRQSLRRAETKEEVLRIFKEEESYR